MKLSALLTALLLVGHARAATITETYSLSTTAVIPDGDLSGLVQTINVTSSTLASIDSLTVQLETSGGWDGDLYAYLWHNGVISVLVNRPGRSAVLPDGSPASGMNITLSDVATIDIHIASGALSGNFQPDQRNVHPLLAMNTDNRTTPLSLFGGAAPTGEWRLFIADVASGDEASIVSWGVSLTGPEAVPEPGGVMLLAMASASALCKRRRVG